MFLLLGNKNLEVARQEFEAIHADGSGIGRLSSLIVIGIFLLFALEFAGESENQRNPDRFFR